PQVVVVEGGRPDTDGRPSLARLRVGPFAGLESGDRVLGVETCCCDGEHTRHPITRLLLLSSPESGLWTASVPAAEALTRPGAWRPAARCRWPGPRMRAEGPRPRPPTPAPRSSPRCR